MKRKPKKLTLSRETAAGVFQAASDLQEALTRLAAAPPLMPVTSRIFGWHSFGHFFSPLPVKSSPNWRGFWKGGTKNPLPVNIDHGKGRCESRTAGGKSDCLLRVPALGRL